MKQHFLIRMKKIKKSLIWKKFLLPSQIIIIKIKNKHKIDSHYITRERGLYPLVGGYVMASAQHCVITKEVKNSSYCFYVRCATLKVWVGWIPWLKTDATHYHAQLELPDKSCAIKELVAYWVLPILIPQVFG